ncbi:MAG TPA: sensor histidine kinase, partial [Allosphingosinicella sp.]|nr:sensor histidine kinase [Allosphingosinicella sp.]
MKYGALSGEDGHVEVRWEISDGVAGDRRLRLVWSERGGPPVSEPVRRGFGTRMIERGLAGELGGIATVEFRPAGVVCTVEAPLPAA